MAPLLLRHKAGRFPARSGGAHLNRPHYTRPAGLLKSGMRGSVPERPLYAGVSSQLAPARIGAIAHLDLLWCIETKCRADCLIAILDVSEEPKRQAHKRAFSRIVWQESIYDSVKR